MKRTIVEVILNINRVHENSISLLNTFLPKYKEKLTLQCNICRNIFYAAYDNLINKGSGYPYCAKHIKRMTSFYLS